MKMKTYQYPAPSTWAEILKRPSLDFLELEEKVSTILEKVKLEGDKALRYYSKQFDGMALKEFKVKKEEFELAEQQVSPQLKKAIQTAFKNIKTFHESQQESPKIVETMPGVQCWRRSMPIQKVGLYIPGGTAPLFSTVLMLGTPAKIAGCEEVILCTPPQKSGEVHPAILYAAKLVGIDQVFKVGGAQAIAGMAYGTQSIPRIYKIFGPGNQFVTAAKMLVCKEGIPIDMPAGPSEVLVLTDGQSNPVFVAADLLSQAEHGADSQVVMVSLDESVIESVLVEIEKQLKDLPRKDIAQKALENSVSILAKNEQEAIDLVNFYAPEHLIVATDDFEKYVDQIRNAGSVFLGNYTPESVGDYASGTNHTLPTNGFAKAYSGVSLDTFVKKISFQKLSKQGLKNIAETVEVMAEAEELMAHKRAVSLRMENLLRDWEINNLKGTNHKTIA